MSVAADVRRALRAVLLGFAAGILFIEEWGWRPLAACVASVARWPPLARLEALIRRLSPSAALVLFIVPAVLLFPLKVAALWLVHKGHAGLGIAIIVAAKLVGTALVGRIYLLTQAQLMQFGWFARALGWWIATKARVRAALARSPAWRRVSALKRRLRIWLRRVRR